jgi:prophage maintenance system killer protein
MLDHIVSHDAAIDDARGAAMLAALDAVRADARSSEPLSFAMLARWQALLIPDASLRRHDAWAKDGRERYAYHKDLGERVEAWLHEANDASVPVVARAARVYLDVCFLHPFADGNARAARLALDFVLTRAGLTVDDADGALFRTPLAVTDPQVGAHYQTLLAHLVRRRG